MLNKQEAEQIEKDILLINKKAMRQILTIGEMVLPKEKYPRFRQSVLNNFGKSGLETDVNSIIEKYKEK